MMETSREELIKICEEKARTLHTSEESRSFKMHGFYKKIRMAQKSVERKIDSGIEISEAEKWLYENFHYVYKAIFGSRADFYGFPSLGGVPRILVLARTIVNNSLGDLTPERVKSAMDAIGKTVPLEYKELIYFKDAFTFALIEQIYVLADKLLFLEKIRKISLKKHVYKRLLNNESYLYLLIQNKRKIDLLLKGGVDEKRVRINHGNAQCKNLLCAKTLFIAMQNIDEYFSSEEGVKKMGSYALLKKKCHLESVDINTLLFYFERIAFAAKKSKVSEEFAGKILIHCIENNGLDISEVLIDRFRYFIKAIKKGEYVFPKYNDRIRENIFISTVVIISAATTVGTYFIFRSVLVSIVLFIPIFLNVDKLLFAIFSAIRPKPDCPKLRLEKITPENATTVVISAFCTSADDLKEIMFRAESISDVRKEEYINCILLVDTPESSQPISNIDKSLADYFSQNNKRKDIYLFLRKKVFDGKKYVAKERKRGAIEALMRYFVEFNKSDFYFISDTLSFTPVYFVSLDTDNAVLPGGIMDMIERIAHPYNKKFTILSSVNRINLFSVKTFYSQKYLSLSGFERYPFYTGSFYKTFGKDIFCGKGIIRVKEFFATLNGLFPMKKILSHDIPEGAIVGCGSGGTTFEDAPDTFLSDEARKKRWTAGDIQNLPFILGRWKNEEGEKVRMNLSPLYRYMMTKNILCLFVPFLVFSLFIIGFTIKINVLLAAISILFIPFFFDMILAIRKIIFGCNFRSVFRQIRETFLTFWEQFFMLPYNAVSQLSVFVKTILRMLTGKNLLEWKTFSQSKKLTEASRYASIFMPSIVLMTSLLTGAFFMQYTLLFYYGAGYFLCVLLTYCMQYFLSTTSDSHDEPNMQSKKVLTDVARSTYSYFSFMKNETVIADNLQINPYKGQTNYTSSTDIGFALLAEICAIELNFITLEQGMKNVVFQLQIIEKLPKWNGNLYNWYFVDSMLPTNNFVSSVDEGNFLLSIFLVKEFFSGKNNQITELAEMLFDQADLTKLYDKNKRLFYVGIGDGAVGHYDLLCSESRILSMMFIMKYGTIDNYYSLIREYASSGENYLLSWGGTAFEALMPELFFPSPERSIFGITKFITGIKLRKNKYNGLWGVSESGYFCFDNALHYQYKSFGLPQLSVSSDTDNMAISPYSSILCLSGSTYSVVRNMEKMTKNGLYGEYGYYESIDAKEGKIVRQYMTHHQGMILCSIVDVLCDGVFKKLVIQSPIGYGACLVLNEMPSTKKVFSQKKQRKIPKSTKQKKYVIENNNVDLEPLTVALTDGKTRIFCNSNGSCFSYSENICIQKKMPEYWERGGGMFFCKRNNKIVTPTFLPYGDDKKYTFSYNGTTAEYRCIDDNISEKVSLLPGLSAICYTLRTNKEDEVYFYSDIVLNKEEAYFSHPTFSDLFIHSERISDDTVLFTRRGKHEIYLAVKVSGGKKYDLNTNRKNCYERGVYSRLSPFLKCDENSRFGDVLTPCFSFSATIGKSNSISVCFMFGTNRNDLLSTISLLPSDLVAFAENNHYLYLLQQNTINCLANYLYGKYKYDFNNLPDNIPFGKELYCNIGCDKDIDRYIETYKDMRLLLLYPVLIFSSTQYDEVIEKKCKMNRVEYRICDNIFPESKNVIFNKEMISDCDNEEDLNEAPHIDYKCGQGGFDSKGNYIIYSEKMPKGVYSHIVAGEHGGSLITATGGGFYWFNNARENKVIRFDNDPVGENKGENLLLCVEEKRYPLLGGMGKNRYTILGKGYFSHSLSLRDIHVKTTVSAVFDGRARVLEISVSDLSCQKYRFEYSFSPSLSSLYDGKDCVCIMENGLFQVKNIRNGQQIFYALVGEKCLSSDNNKSIPTVFWKGDKTDKYYLVCSPDKNLLASLTTDNLSLYVSNFIRKAEELSDIEIVGGSKGLENILSYLPYQVVVSRLFGRTGFYQVGGAIGFRDQLQDAMALFTRPELLRKQILISCAHQYEEGDVMHWWHPPKFGLRTRITDDKLFLPLAVIRYISVSMDTNILNIEVEYLTSEQLRAEENSRYENPPEGKKESVLKHCLRAIRSSLKYGEHRLLIMGSGDWNDGMDEVCKKGIGESVFNSMLAYYILTHFGSFCPDEVKKELLQIAVDLKKAINTYAFSIDRYVRLFSDDNKTLGTKECDILELDLLVQAVAVLSGVAEGERAEIVLETCKKLIDKNACTIGLLSPPQTSAYRLGYISDYPPGIRENGGQYTHAAIWYLIALCRIGKQDEAYELFCMINPAEKCADKAKNEMYGGEPYVLSGDVYTNKDNYGACGWSWYTGSAGWAYRLICEEFFGLKRRGDRLFIEPKLPKKLDGSTLTYRYKNSIYMIEYHFGLRKRLISDGVSVEYVELKEGQRSLITFEIGL